MLQGNNTICILVTDICEVPKKEYFHDNKKQEIHIIFFIQTSSLKDDSNFNIEAFFSFKG